MADRPDAEQADRTEDEKPAEDRAPKRPRPVPPRPGTRPEPARDEAEPESATAPETKAVEKDEKPDGSKEKSKRTGKGLSGWVRTLRSS